MSRSRRRIEGEARQHFLLDDVVSVRRSGLRDVWYVTIHRWNIGDGSIPSGIDKTKEYIYLATFDGCKVVFTKQKSDR